jgi:hypothetical protein
MQPKCACGAAEEKMFCDLAGGHARPNTLRSMVAKTVLSIIAFCCAISLSRASGPPNDFCAGAEVIPGNAGATQPWYSTEQDIVLATTNGDPVFCHEFVNRSIWYVFTPQTSAAYTFSTCNGPTTVADTEMALYTSANGCNGPFTRLQCAFDSCGPDGLLSSIADAPLVAGATYYVVVWQYFDPLDPPPLAGLVQLCVTRSTAPINDICATAQEVRLNVPLAGTTSGAANNYELPAASPCFSGVGQAASTAPGRDVVYWFEAPSGGQYNFRVYNYYQNNLVLYVAGACPATGNPAIVANCLGAANRSLASTAEEVLCVSLAANQRVFIFVDEHGFTAGSSFTLEVNRCYREREPNNAWTNASYMACGMVGTIQPGSDIDCYHLGSPSAGSRAFVLINSESANGTDFDLRIIYPGGTLEYDEQDNDSEFGSFSPNIAGTPLPGGAVYARVNYNGGAAEPYHIYATVQPPLASASPESEPNDTPAEANFATANYYRGMLPTSADMDVYGVTAQRGDLIFTSLDGDPTRANTPVNAKVELLNEFETILVTVDDGNGFSTTNSGAGNFNASTPSSPAEGFVYRIANEGTYYVRVTISPNATGQAAAGDYLLSISKICSVPSARLRSIGKSGATVNVEMEGVPSASYDLQYSNDLTTWNLLRAQSTDSNGILQFQDTPPGSAQRRFYRVVLR